MRKPAVTISVYMETDCLLFPLSEKLEAKGPSVADGARNGAGNMSRSNMEWLLFPVIVFVSILSILKTPFRLQILNLSNQADSLLIHVEHPDFVILRPFRRLSIPPRTPNRDPCPATPDHRLEAFRQSPKTPILGPIPLAWAPSI